MGLGVNITNKEEIEDLHSCSFFGKGVLSRSKPVFFSITHGIKL